MVAIARAGAGRAVIVMIVLAGVAASACSKIEEQYTADVAFSEATGNRRISNPGDMPTFDLRVDCMPAHRARDGSCEKITMREFNEAAANSPEMAILRNRFQDYLLWRSEQQCERHKAGILSTQASSNLVLNTVTTGTSAVAAIVVAPAASILAAIAAISSGTRSHINEDIYQKFVGPAVVRRINVDRENMFAIIMSKRGVSVADRQAGNVVSTVATGTTSTPAGKMTEVATTSTAPGGKPSETNTKVTTTTIVATTDTKANVSSIGEIRSTINYSAPRRVVTLQDYSVEEALGDVERYHQLCSFSSGLASLIEPGAKFEDSAAGIQQRINLLREQQAQNEKQYAIVGDPMAKRRLAETNADISRQIMTLQQRLLTAPLTVGGKPTGG
jgi:hypothetical protein